MGATEKGLGLFGWLVAGLDSDAAFTRRSLIKATALGALPALLKPQHVNQLLRAQVWRLPAAQAAKTHQNASTIIVGNLSSGAFTRVRAVNDDTRLVLTYPAFGVPRGRVDGAVEPAPAAYGYDQGAFPARAGGRTGLQQLQDLFENTPLAYLGFYLGKAPNYPGHSWMNWAPQLLAQGWTLIPIYVGRQQENPPKKHLALIAQRVADAKQQGKDDGAQATNLAAKANLPDSSVLFLDIETDKSKIEERTFAYIDAWFERVGASSYTPGLYCAAAPAKALHDHVRRTRPKTPFYASRSWFTRPLDGNGDVRPVPIAKPAGAAQPPPWDFVAFADVWQFKTDWIGRLEIHADTGETRAWPATPQKIDFDAAKAADPGNTSGGKKKSALRRTVKELTGPSSLKVGATAEITVNLDGKAPMPDGVMVIIRASSPALIVRNAVRVKGGEVSATVAASTVPLASAERAKVTARALHQLEAPAASLSIAIEAA